MTPSRVRMDKPQLHSSQSKSVQKFVSNNGFVGDAVSDGVYGDPGSSVPSCSPKTITADSIHVLSRNGSSQLKLSADKLEPSVRRAGKAGKDLLVKTSSQQYKANGAETEKKLHKCIRHESLSSKPILLGKPLNHNTGFSDAKSQVHGNDVRHFDSKAEMGRDSNASREASLTSSPEISGRNPNVESGYGHSEHETRSEMLCPKSSTIFQTPPGYKPSQSAPLSTTLPLLSPTSLLGKELWCFTMPKSLPFAAVQNISLRTLENGHKAFSHHSIDYKFVDESRFRKNGMHVFNAQSGGADFSPLGMELIRSFSVFRCANAASHEIEHAARKVQPSPSELRSKIRTQQTQRLKLRYRPIGCGSVKSDRHSKGQTAGMGPLLAVYRQQGEPPKKQRKER